jgi:hypothetical protein
MFLLRGVLTADRGRRPPDSSLESVRHQVGVSRQRSDIYLSIVCRTPGRQALLVFDISDHVAFQIDGEVPTERWQKSWPVGMKHLDHLPVLLRDHANRLSSRPV